MATNRVPYRTSLRVLGRLLNGDKARMVTVCEIEQGFLLHYFQQGEPQCVASRAIHTAEVLDLDDLLHKQRGKPALSGSLKGLQSIFGSRPDEALRFQKSHPLCPMGYEEFLRALGDALDRRHAQAVLIAELDDRIHVEYTVDRADFVVRQGQRMALPGRRQESYTAQQIPTFVQTCRQRAIEQVQRSGQHLSFNPMDVGSYLAAGPVLEDHDQYREAEELYRRALDIAPNHPEVHYHLACHARRRGDRKAALKHVESAILHSGGQGHYFHLLGRLHVERNKLTEALQAWQQAISCDPDNPVYHFHLSQVNERLGPDGDVRAIRTSGHVGTDGEGAPGTRTELWDDAEAPGDRDSSAPGDRDSSAPGDRRQATGDRRPIAAGERDRSAPGDGRQAAGDSSVPDLSPGSSRPIAAGEHDSSAPDLSPVDYRLSPDTPRRSLAARLEALVPAMDDDEPAPPMPAYPVTSEPFESAAREWESDGPSGHAALPPHVESPLGGAAPLGAPVDGSGSDGLPTLGLSLTDEWSTSRLPALEMPADGAAAAAALPLAGVNLDRPLPDAAAAHEPWTPPDVMPALAATTEPAQPSQTETAQPSNTEDAVQLAAAIMRAEELVHAEPHRADLHRKLGFLLARQGRSEDAAAEFRRAVECGRRRVQ